MVPTCATFAVALYVNDHFLIDNTEDFGFVKWRRYLVGKLLLKENVLGMRFIYVGFGDIIMIFHSVQI